MSHNFKSGGASGSLSAQPLLTPIKRRSFFMYAGATAGATALLLSGCDDDYDIKNEPVLPTTAVGSGDAGVLNYAYALEQLEAAFYAEVRRGGYYASLDGGSAERQILDDLYYHEVIHRDFFKTALMDAGAQMIKDLVPNFGAINFGDRASVLGAAKSFEDLGVAAYNGAARFIATRAYIGIAGKIVSVEARHAAIIRDLLVEGSFVGNDVVHIDDNTSLERSMLPSAVALIANQFLSAETQLDVTGLG